MAAIKRNNLTPFKITQGGAANKATQITFTPNTCCVDVLSDVGDTFISNTGVDGEDIDTGAFRLMVGKSHTVMLDRKKYGHPPVLYIANDTATTGVTRLDPTPRNKRRGQ